jgi:hypothetical protein
MNWVVGVLTKEFKKSSPGYAFWFFLFCWRKSDSAVSDWILLSERVNREGRRARGGEEQGGVGR